MKLIESNKSIKAKSLLMAQGLAICVFIFMLSSKFGILALALNLFLLLLYYIKKSKKVIAAVIVFLAFSALSILLISETPLKNRFMAAYETLVSPSDKPSSTRARIDVWEVTAEVISENPIWGVGAGDIRQELLNKYEEKNFTLYRKRGYDSHQEFLQTYASLGVLGFLVLVSIFLLMFWQSYHTRNYILFLFTLLFLLFGMVESMLERQAGVVFFVFFGLYLFSYNPQKYHK